MGHHKHHSCSKCRHCLQLNDVRSYDGRNNNLRHPDQASVGAPLLRKGHSDYSNGISDMAQRYPDNPNPRVVSNAICAAKYNPSSPQKLSNMFWAFLQFIDHTIDLTLDNTGESANMTTPPNDPVLPNATIHFVRSVYTLSSGTSVENPREQINLLPAYVDAGNIYGFDETRAQALRKNDGTGYLLTTTNAAGETLLPLNTEGLPNAILPGTDPTEYYLAGDIRSNENVLLLGLHTKWALYHNVICDEIVEKHPDWLGQDEWIYQHARRIVTGTLQWILYHEVLPYLFGAEFKPWDGYDPHVDAGINTEFSTVAFRLGHSMLPETLVVSGKPDLPLKDAFFNPNYVTANGVDGVIEGGWKKIMKKVDPIISEAVRSHLFGSPQISENMLLDLAAINMQRGRDHGIGGYNYVREKYGLCHLDFDEISTNPQVNQKLRELYDDADAIDPWVGGLCEDPVKNGLVGSLFRAILKDQFKRLRDGDRFWFENDPNLSHKEKRRIKRMRLSDVLRITTSEEKVKYIPGDVFHVNA